jgi:hypothetical protein
LESVNLYQETLDDLASAGKTAAEVVFVAVGTVWGPWSEFVKTSNFDYDEGYGNWQINTELIVVGSGWWLKRAGSDSGEWWSFQTGNPPAKPTGKSSLTTQAQLQTKDYGA